MSSLSCFSTEKKRVLKEFHQTLADQLVDNKVIPILDIINSHKDYYSTSSCSGRVLLIALARPGAKSKSKMLSRWHDEITLDELQNSIKKWYKYPYLYLLAQPPIFHITTHDLKSAILLRNLGEGAGLKYSTIRSIKQFKRKDESRIIVELLGTERLNVPLGFDGKVYVDDEYLKLLVEMANEVLIDSDVKIKKLVEMLREKL